MNEPELPSYPPAEVYNERIEAAAAALLIELAFLVPRGTNIAKHPIAQKLVNYRNAIEDAVHAHHMRGR